MVSALTIVFANLSVVNVGVGILLAYPAYWALDIRHASAVRLYRSQALGIGLVSIAIGLLFVLFSASDLLPPSPSLVSTFIILYNLGAVFVLVTTFYWVDGSVLAGRRSDPLLRDTLSWGRIRRLVWGTLILFSALLIILSFSIGPGPSLVFLVGTVVFAVPLVSGSILLPVVARRSGDPLLRKQLRYFALFLFSLMAQLLFYNIFGHFIPTRLGLSVGALILVAASYFLYRSARSLAPLNRIPSD